MLQYKISFDEMEWESPIEGVKCKSYIHQGRKVRLIQYTKDMPQHWCDKGHWGYILDGEIEIEYPNEKHTYKRGDGVFIPDGEEHKHKGRVLGDSATVIFVENA